jgi:hypothetical protein
MAAWRLHHSDTSAWLRSAVRIISQPPAAVDQPASSSSELSLSSLPSVSHVRDLGPPALAIFCRLDASLSPSCSTSRIESLRLADSSLNLRKPCLRDPPTLRPLRGTLRPACGGRVHARCCRAARTTVRHRARALSFFTRSSFPRSRPKADARLVLCGSVGWASPCARRLRGGDAPRLSPGACWEPGVRRTSPPCAAGSRLSWP